MGQVPPSHPALPHSQPPHGAASAELGRGDTGSTDWGCPGHLPQELHAGDWVESQGLASGSVSSSSQQEW